MNCSLLCAGYPNFAGSLQHVIINGHDLLEMEKNKVLSKSENSAQFQISSLLQHNQVRLQTILSQKPTNTQPLIIYKPQTNNGALNSQESRHLSFR